MENMIKSQNNNINYNVNRKALKAFVRKLSKKKSPLSEEDKEMLELCKLMIEELKYTPHNTKLSLYDEVAN